MPAAAVNTNVKDALFMVRHLQENNFFEVNKTELRFLFALIVFLHYENISPK